MKSCTRCNGIGEERISGKNVVCRQCRGSGHQPRYSLCEIEGCSGWPDNQQQCDRLWFIWDNRMNQYFYGNSQDEKGYPDEGYALSRLTQLNATNKGKLKAN